MEAIKRVKGSSEEIGIQKKVAGELRHPIPSLFQHYDLAYVREFDLILDREALTNRLNYVNFIDGSIQVHLGHPKYQDSILIKAYPEPCLARELTCRWSGEDISGLNLANYEFLCFVIDDGQSLLMVPAVLKEIYSDRFVFQLPPESYVLRQRQARRYACREINTELIQSGFLATGELVDYSPVGFRIRVRPESSCSFHWFNSDELVTIQLFHDQQIIFSGLCRCIRQQYERRDREIVLTPVDNRFSRFKKKQIRNPRQQLSASPHLVFDHPLSPKRVQLEVNDISPSGFSVYERKDEGVLMPGMIIHGLTINFAGALTIGCNAQVIYRLEENKKGVRCGLAILDMDIKSYSRLNHILISSLDPEVQVATNVDTDELWDFFFDAGFIYPKKYNLIQSHREDFKKTYKKLYQEVPEIARHFICQKNGRIHGHVSMVKAYERAWMIHHHAARTMDNKRAGLKVLKQVMHYLNGMCHLPSSKIDYVMCYYRPENKFPERVFGGFARDLKNVQGCSVDLFSFLPYTTFSLNTRLPDGWSLKESSKLDLWELNRFYSHHSGGLLLSALGVDQENTDDEPLEEVYGRLGFVRKRKTYSLTHRGELYAVLIVNQSDFGFNLSELLNGIQILVIDAEGLPWEALSSAISQVTSVYHADRVPVLFYPMDYVKLKNVPSEKRYQAWILNLRFGNEYLEYMHRKFKTGYQ